VVTALLFAASLAAARAPVVAHPLHTTMAEVTVDRAHNTVRVVVRVFADDFGTAMNAAKVTGSWDARAAAYLSAALTVTNEKRERLPMRDCGTRRQGDLLWLCAEASVSPAQMQRLSLRDQMLCELFADQVNVVRITDGSATRSMLFTRGDAAKSIGS
jgi:predicted PhzF superfamily epimerase YddE/YHI9